MSGSSYNYSRVDGSVSGATSMDSGSQGNLYPRKNNDSKRTQHSSAYVPHNRFSRYATALVNLVPIRFTRVPGSEMPLDRIGLFSNVSFNWLNEYISAGFKNGARDITIPTLAKLDSCQVNGTRIDGLWHTHVVQRGQAGASVPRIAWQFVRTRVLVASFIYLLGMIISFCTPIILLRQIISTTEDRLTVFSAQIDRLKKNQTLNTNVTAINGLNETILGLDNSTNTTLSIKGLPDSIGSLIMIDEIIIFSNIAVLILAEIVSHFLYCWSSSMNLRTATRLRSACLALAYKKLVRSSIRYEASAHQVMTYFVPNSRTLYELIANGPLIFSGPLILVLWSLFMWYSLGNWAVIGILVLVTLYTILMLTAYLTKIFGTRAMNYSLQRISLMQEFIDNIFLAKVTLWDNYFFRKIQDVRKKELREMHLGGLSEGLSLSMVHVIPIVTISATMMTYVLTSQQIVAANAGMKLFGTISRPLGSLFRHNLSLTERVSIKYTNDGFFCHKKLENSWIPCLVLILINLKYCIRNSWLAMSSISRGVISLNKLKAVLTLKDADRFTDKPIDKNLAVTINHGHFTWERDKSVPDRINKRNSLFYLENIPNSRPAESLVDINFYAPKSKLIGICGSCGSGKTSLLLSLMGHLNIVSGHVTIDGTCSYVSQIPWLFDGTLKENILFCETLDASWYYKTVRSCNLNEDIALLPGSDDTDLTTVNVTLAQKQKIALARAVYAQRDINLLDNPLSDVELDESKDIFEKSIVQALGTKTVIMISDRVQFLNRCDIIYVMKEGTIVEQGTHEELLQWNSEYTNLLNSYMKKCRGKSYRSGEQINTSMSQLLTTPGPRGVLSSTSTAISSNFDTDEEMISVEVNEDPEAPMKQTINENRLRMKENFYVRNAGGWTYGIWIIVISAFFSILIASSPLLFMYIAQKTISDPSHIVIILSSIMGFMALSAVAVLAFYNRMVFAAARKIHAKWLQGLYRAQISVFATISHSILLNVCSLNLQEVDYTVPRLMTTVLMHMGIIIFSVVILGILSFWLLIPITMFILGSICYIVYAKRLTLSLQETVQTNSAIPIYNHSANTIAGRAVIQAYHKEREFAKNFYKYCDNNSTIDFMLHAIKLWIECRIKMLSALTLGVIVLICASLSDIRDHYEILGFALICALQLALSIVNLTEALTSVHASLLVIDAVNDYVDSMPKEKDCKGSLPDEWPYEHSITFKNVFLATKSQKEAMNITIGPGEKVVLTGIKPTLKSLFVASLYKFVEITSGEIYLSNTSINEIRTEKLRKSINFVPSEAILFDGTIRYNLDPNAERADKTLMMALQKVHLWERVSRLTDKLESSASLLFKSWERKLLFLARALLNNSSKIIIIEESLEHLGSDADIVDNVLHDVFTEYTIIALSNRPVRYAEKIYILDDGKIVEVSAVRSHSSRSSIVDLSVSTPKNIIQTNF